MRTAKYYKDNKARFRTEIHERFSAATYAIVFAILATVYLARPRTTREGRAGILFTAFTIGTVIRLVGIAGINMVGKDPGARFADLRRTCRRGRAWPPDAWLRYQRACHLNATLAPALAFKLSSPATRRGGRPFVLAVTGSRYDDF